MKHTTWSSGLSVSADGTGVVAHAGSVAVRLLADRTGLTGELSKALASGPCPRLVDTGLCGFLICRVLVGVLHLEGCWARGNSRDRLACCSFTTCRDTHGHRGPCAVGHGSPKQALPVASCVTLAVTGVVLALGLL